MEKDFDWASTGFYVGFVPLKNGTNKKEPTVAYTNKENHIDLQTAQGHKSFSAVLAKNAVLIECDDKENSDFLFRIIKGEGLGCLVSDREGGQGLHSLFYNNGEMSTATKSMLACGIIVDIKVGERNGLECLKWQDKERMVLYHQNPYQEVPKYFKPIKGCNIDFTLLGEGDGRNSVLYSYILTLQRYDFSVDEIKECIRIINKYVLKQPVTDKELEVILRDEAFKKPIFFKGTTFLHDRFAEHIKRNYHVKKINGQLHLYKDGVYEPGYSGIEKAMYKEIPSLTDSKRKEVLKQLELICEEISIDDRTASLIAFRNGIYDLNTGKLKPFNPETVLTNRIPWDFNPAAYSEIADKTLDKIACFDPQIRKILEECVGSCFYRSNTLGGGKAFILTGEGSNGKSTFLEVIQAILSDKNYSVLDFKDLDDRFSTVMLFGKLANLGDDISGEFNPDVAVFKKITRGNSIDAEYKGQQKFQFKPYCKLIFCANTIPRMKDDTGAALNRLIIIPFNARFTKDSDDYDPGIKWKLTEQESLEYIIRLGIEGLKRVLDKKIYTTSKKVDEQLNDYKIINNPILSFILFCAEEEIAIENETAGQVYENYSAYCVKNNFKALASNEFSKQLKRITGFETKRQVVNKKKVTVYVDNRHA